MHCVDSGRAKTGIASIQERRGVKTGGAKKDIASMDLTSEDRRSEDTSEDRHCVGRFYRSRGGAKTGIASVDFIAVAARGGSKSAGLTWRVSWLVAAE
jgi:hypothetical protein